jgi:hypothetical protein
MRGSIEGSRRRLAGPRKLDLIVGRLSKALVAVARGASCMGGHADSTRTTLSSEPAMHDAEFWDLIDQLDWSKTGPATTSSSARA